MPQGDSDFLIAGQLLDQATNQPLSGMMVRAFALEPSAGETLLGTDLAKQDGAFEISFSRETDREIDVVLEIVDAAGNHVVDAASGALIPVLGPGEHRSDVVIRASSTNRQEHTTPATTKRETSGAFAKVIDKALRKSKIRSTQQLREHARATGGLRELSDEPDVLQTLTSYVDLTRVFLPMHSLALLVTDGKSVKEVASWTDRQFLAALNKSGVRGADLEFQAARFSRLKSLVRDRSAEEITEIEIDVPDFDSAADVRRELRALDVETWSDWERQRSRLRLSKDVAEKLNLYDRLRSLGIEGNSIPALEKRGIDSALALTTLSAEAIQRLEREDQIKRTRTEQWIKTAASRIDAIYRWTQIDPFAVADTLDQPTDPNLKTCDSCPPDQSAFSKFGYFVYLANKTGINVPDLDKILFQDFMTLSPYDGYDPVPQAEICLQVLSRISQRPLSSVDRKLADLHLAFRGWAISRLSAHEFAAALQQSLGQLSSDLIRRLRQSPADPISRAAGFSETESEAMQQVASRLVLVQLLPHLTISLSELVQLVKGELPSVSIQEFILRVKQLHNWTATNPLPEFTDEEVSLIFRVASANTHRLGRQSVVDPWEIAIRDATVLLRDAHKQRLGKTDVEIFDTWFIESNLAACEMSNRICQAIFSLQALLDRLGRAAESQQERTEYRYHGYEAWRAERVGEFFPEARAIMRGDVLVGDEGPMDRGSYLRDEAAQRQLLRDSLQQVRTAIDSARLSTESQEQFDEDDFDSLARFSTTPYYEPFLAGLQLITKFLDTDEQVVEAQQHLERDATGLAISSLTDAMLTLDEISSVVFPGSSPWLKKTAEQLAEFQTISANQRRSASEELADRLQHGPKRIFDLVAATEIGGLDPASGRFLDVGELLSPTTRWRRHGSFSLQTADGAIVLRKQRRTDGDSLTQQRTYYGDDGLASNYSLVISFRLPEHFDGGLGLEVGACIRLQGQASDAVRGYQVVLTRKLLPQPEPPSTNNDILDGILAVGGAIGEFLFGEEDDHFLGSELFLVAQKVETNGNVTALGETLIALDDRLDHLKLDPDAVYRISVSVSQDALDAAFLAPDFDPFTLQVSDGSYTTGSFGVVASHALEVEFQTIQCRIPTSAIAPPFHAKRRLGTSEISLSHLELHRSKVDPSARVILSEWVRPSTEFTFVERGIEGPQSAHPFGKWLVFPPAGHAVDLENLDLWLEQCLEGLLYLRLAAIPVILSKAQYQQGDYEQAAQTLRNVYDDLESTGTEIYPFLATDQNGGSIGPDAKLMRLRLAEIYLAQAEWLFRQNEADSRYRARQLVQRVLELHGGASRCNCDEKVRDLIVRLTTGFAVEVSPGRQELEELIQRIKELLRQGLMDGNLLDGAGFPQPPGPQPDPVDVPAALRGFKNRLEQGLATRKRDLAQRNRVAALGEKTRGLAIQAETHFSSRTLADPIAEAFQPADRRSRITQKPGAAGVAPLRFPPAVVQNLRGRPAGAGKNSRLGYLAQWLSFTLCLPENPLQRIQRKRACLLHDHLLNCRNVLGYPEDLVPPLRYETLHRLASAFTDLALSAERDLLNFRREAESSLLSFIEAQQNLALVAVSVELENNRVKEAEGDRILADLQLRQSAESMNHLDGLVETGLLPAEQGALGALRISQLFTFLAGGAGAIGSVAGAAGGGPVSLAAGGFSAVGGLASTGASFLQTQSQIASLQASYERREQEWRYQLALSQLGFSLSQQALQQAVVREQIAFQQRQLAELRQEFAADGLNFLANRFLNEALFVWMMQTVREEYRTRLNYSIDAAFMAERALSFELPENHRVIRFDYFDPRRDGMLGATQLQTDLATLQHLKLGATERKLQLSKTISLRQRMPFEFERFKTSGRLPFSTLIDWFDRDFPGHYLRLIKSIKVTVLALVPPATGVHATLHNSGVSTVVAGPPDFEPTTVRRDPESIALSSPVQDSGVFVLDYHGELLLPFEGSGVETNWILSMPQAANAFDFDTIADVMLEMEYTALQSPTYRDAVIERLGTEESADRAYSVRIQAPDEWYHLHHPREDRPLKAELVVQDRDFPASISSLRVQHLTLDLIWEKDVPQVELDVTLKFTAADGNVFSAPPITTLNGLIRTRNSTAPAWSQVFRDVSPLGRWSIEFENSAEVRNLFSENRLQDIMFVISFVGQRADW